MNPDEYCQQKAHQSGSSFYYSFLFLSPEKRKAVMAVYAFCRQIDDIVDETLEPEVAQRQLSWWSEEVARLFAGNPNHPITQALLPHLAEYGWQRAWFDSLIEGMWMDLSSQRYPTFEALDAYAYRVAGVVGLLSASLFGYQDPKTLEYAKTLGSALQLVNIIRDVGEDARRKRIYLPEEDCHRFGVTPESIFAYEHTDAFRALLAFEATRAEGLRDKALDLLPETDRYAQLPGLIMARIYFTLLEEIRSSKFQVLDRRVRLTPIRKCWIALRLARAEKKRSKKWQRTLVTS